jgi:hypothetical protein
MIADWKTMDSAPSEVFGPGQGVGRQIIICDEWNDMAVVRWTVNDDHGQPIEPAWRDGCRGLY